MAVLFPLKWCCMDMAFEALIKNMFLAIFLIWLMICVISMHTIIENQYNIFLTIRKKVLYNLSSLQENN